VGGASIAFAQDSLSMASNPAGFRLLDSGLDIAIMGFFPSRGGSLDTSKLFGEAVDVSSKNPFFLAPNIGASWKLSPRLSVGVVMYGSGGMNTEYETNVYHRAFTKPIGLFSAAAAGQAGYAPGGPENEIVKGALLNAPNTGTLGVNLEQAVLAPSLAYAMTSSLDVGVSVLVGFQRFIAQGLGDFVSFSSRPTKLTNNGHDFAIGAGLRLGLSYRPTDWLTVGASAASKVYMTPFEKYSGLFAEQGDFDIPANTGIGLTIRPLGALTLTTDITRIFYEGVASVSNPGPTADQLLAGFNQALRNGYEAQGSASGVPVNKGAIRPLGSDAGYGFGWRDIWVVKMGAAYDITSDLRVMAGYTYGENPVSKSESLFNIIAPAVVQHHLGGGATFKLTEHHALTATYMHVFEGNVSGKYRAGPETTEALAGSPNLELGLDASNRMSQDVVDLGYRYQF